MKDNGCRFIKKDGTTDNSLKLYRNSVSVSLFQAFGLSTRLYRQLCLYLHSYTKSKQFNLVISNVEGNKRTTASIRKVVIPDCIQGKASHSFEKH